MERTGEFIRGLVLLIIGILLAGAIAWRWLRTTRDDPARLVFKWILSAVVIAGMVFGIVPIILDPKMGQAAAFFIVFIAAGGVFLAIIWAPNITEWLSRPFENLYTGGSAAPEPEPLYSIAIAKRKQGKYLESVAELRKQLAQFPNDVTGQMMLAEIQAEDLNDLPAAQLTIERFCSQPGHAPRNIAYALNALADWHIKQGRDVETARQILARIGEMLPDSEEALLAAQRLSHMGDADYLLGRGNRPALPLRAGIDNIGLMKDSSHLAPKEINPEELAAEYVKHLEQHPADMEVRLKLTVLYAEHYRRLDLAADQIEQMIQQPGQPMKEIVHCLNLLADLHIKCAADYEGAKTALERIVEMYPKYAPAENARQRISYLKLEMRGRETTTAVKLGTYDQNIGLKRFKAPGVPE